MCCAGGRSLVTLPHTTDDIVPLQLRFVKRGVRFARDARQKEEETRMPVIIRERESGSMLAQADLVERA